MSNSWLENNIVINNLVVEILLDHDVCNLKLGSIHTPNANKS